MGLPCDSPPGGRLALPVGPCVCLARTHALPTLRAGSVTMEMPSPETIEPGLWPKHLIGRDERKVATCRANRRVTDRPGTPRTRSRRLANILVTTCKRLVNAARGGAAQPGPPRRHDRVRHHRLAQRDTRAPREADADRLLRASTGRTEPAARPPCPAHSGDREICSREHGAGFEGAVRRVVIRSARSNEEATSASGRRAGTSPSG